jgi:hypothetical protein
MNRSEQLMYNRSTSYIQKRPTIDSEAIHSTSILRHSRTSRRNNAFVPLPKKPLLKA